MVGDAITEKRPPEELEGVELSEPEREAIGAIWYIKPSIPLPPEVTKKLLRSVKIIS